MPIAVGMIETLGFPSVVEAADAMVKANANNEDSTQTTFSDRIRLNFDTSFSGKDRLRVRLQASNLDVPNSILEKQNNLSLLKVSDFKQIKETFGLSSTASGDNQLLDAGVAPSNIPLPNEFIVQNGLFNTITTGAESGINITYDELTGQFEGYCLSDPFTGNGIIGLITNDYFDIENIVSANSANNESFVNGKGEILGEVSVYGSMSLSMPFANEEGEILGVATLYGPVVADDGTLLLPGGLFVATNLSNLVG